MCLAFRARALSVYCLLGCVAPVAAAPALNVAGCSGDTVPPEVSRLLTRVNAILVRAAQAPPLRAHRLVPRVLTLLSHASTQVTSASGLSSSCTAALLDTISVIEGSARALVVSIFPEVDTYIQHGDDAAHDADTQLVVGNGQVIYLKFDLTTVPEGVAAATLVLHPEHGGAHGLRLWALDDTSWQANLSWSDVDRNGDGSLDASDGSTLVPVGGQLIATLGLRPRNVKGTGALRAGARPYTLALAAAGGSLALSSHETNRGPSLEIVRSGIVTIPAASCLQRGGEVVVLNGTYGKRYDARNLNANETLDARNATFLAGPDNLYPLEVGGGDGTCIVGATIQGSYDRNLSWQAMHDMNNAAIAFTSGNVTLEGIRIDNVEDGFRPQAAGMFTVRGSWLSYIRDDCIENDHLQPGLVDDSLFDGCYVAFSARPTDSIINDGFDGRGSLWTVQNSLVRLEPEPGPRGGAATDRGNGNFFKWHHADDPATSLSPSLALYGNIFLAEQASQDGPGTMGIPTGKLTGCANNTMVWLGPGDYPAPLPSCFTVTRDRSAWDSAVARWHLRHARP